MANGQEKLPPLEPRALRILRARRRARLVLLGLILAILVAVVAARAGARQTDHERYHQRWFEVAEVLEGDALLLTSGGLDPFVVRLIGVDAHGSPEAREVAHKACGDRVLLYLETVPTRNHAGELLAYAYTQDQSLINGRMIDEGAAFADRRWEYSHLRTFLQMEEQARQRKRGMWAGPGDPPMPEWRRRWLAEMAKEPWKRQEWRRADEP